MGILTGGWNPFRTPLRELVGGITGNQYLAGKEGYLPDIKLPQLKIKGTPVKEVFSKEGYQAGGEWWRKAGTSRFEGFATGLFGVGAVEYAKGDEGWLPDWGRPGEYSKVVDTSGEGGGLVNITIPDFPEIPELPKIPDFPTIPEIPDFPTIDLSGIGEGLAAGLAALGAGLGGGMPQMPSMPSMELVDEDGAPNLLLIGGLALIAYKVLGGGK